jgi:predicted ATP-grasp superfamily ATP-dependent carboligase
VAICGNERGYIMQVLVTNAKSRIGYLTTRNLARHGVSVTAGDYTPLAMTFFSRHCRGRLVYPSPYDQPQEFLKRLYDWGEEHTGSVLLPTYDETILISQHQATLKDVFRMAVPDYASIQRVHHKDLLPSVARTIDIRTPETTVAYGPEDIETMSARWGYPVVVKPCRGAGAWGISYVEKDDRPSQAWHHALESTGLTPGQLLVQQYIPAARKYSYAAIYRKSELVAWVVLEHLRDHPPSGGSGTFVIAREDQEIETASRSLLNHLGWHGVAEIEFVRHRDTGELYLMEVNPRLWGCISGALKAGIEFPYILLQVALGIDVDHSGPQKYGARGRWLLGDLRVIWSLTRTPHHKEEALRAMCDLFDRVRVEDELSWDDPLPFILSPVHTIGEMVKQRTFRPKRGGF